MQYHCPYFDKRNCSRYCLNSILYENQERSVALGRCREFYDSYVLFSSPPSEGLKNYYDKDRLKEYCAYYEPFRKRRFVELLQLGSMKNFAGTAALDIGCGFGWFLETLQQRGWPRLVGIDYSLAGRLAKEKGFEIIIKKFSPSLQLGERFDLIILSNVLEHLWHPLDCLRWIKNHLHPEGGRLLLTVPIADGIIMRLSHLFIRTFPRRADATVRDIYQTESTMGHLVLYSTAGVIKLCQMAGFAVIERDISPIVDARNIKKRMLIEMDRLTAKDHLRAWLLKWLLRFADRGEWGDELTLVLTPGGEKKR